MVALVVVKVVEAITRPLPNHNHNSLIATRFRYFSGHLPTVTFPLSESDGAGVARVYYMSALTVLSQMRTNLPFVFARVWPNGNGNVGHTTMGIGGSRSWWWDEGLTSMLLALLEPESRPPTYQAWLDHDDHPGTKFGHGKGNGYAMDCKPLGSGTCFASGSCAMCDKDEPVKDDPEYGFYCYNPWACKTPLPTAVYKICLFPCPSSL